MSEWNRTTKEITLETLPADLKQAILTHIERHTLGDILSPAQLCIQTDSVKPKKGLFGSAEETRTVVVLTPHWLIWAVSGAKSAPGAISAQLTDITVQDYAQSSFAKLVPDTGISINGRFTATSENSTSFIGLQENAVGAKFKELLISAVQKAKGG